jgi:hypothetical protein
VNDSAVCRHNPCGNRFALSRYGNRTYTSERRRKAHLFCRFMDGQAALLRGYQIASAQHQNAVAFVNWAKSQLNEIAKGGG